jgi:tetratricopeptide (TPR) repeat protein
MGKQVRCLACAAALALLPGATNPARAADEVLPPDPYEVCMALARENPGAAFARAGTWQAEGGGDPARHCAAVALIELGQLDEAARQLEALAQDLQPAHLDLRAEVLGQAGQAWLLAGENERAHAAQSAAIEIDPKNIDLWIDRSVTLASAQNYWEAIDDLNHALDLDPDRAEALIFRASAYRYLDALELALEDVTKALGSSPDDPDGLLERGILRRLIGDDLGARADWQAVIKFAPETPAAESARRNLERMDVKVE